MLHYRFTYHFFFLLEIMTQTHADRMTAKAKNNFTSLSFVSQPLLCVNKSSTSIRAVNKPHTLHDLTHDSNSHSLSSSNHSTTDDNIDWELVTQQLEAVRLETKEKHKRFFFFLSPNRNCELQQIIFDYRLMNIIA